MKLAPHLLGAVAVAAYTYMALVPLIQPPIMALLTTKKERVIRMKSLRTVSKSEKLFFAVLVTIVTILLIPDASPLIGMLMLGNFLRECKVTERLVQASQNEIINIVTIFLGTSVGLTMQGDRFLQKETLLIILLGIVAFGVATAGGVIAAKLMNLIWRKNPVNPLIGSAGVSAVPMGGPRLPQCGPEVRSLQLPSHARHGTERCGRDRHRSHRRLLHCHSGEIT